MLHLLLSVSAKDIRLQFIWNVLRKCKDAICAANVPSIVLLLSISGFHPDCVPNPSKVNQTGQCSSTISCGATRCGIQADS